jgi:hypothetical protein
MRALPALPMRRHPVLRTALTLLLLVLGQVSAVSAAVGLSCPRGSRAVPVPRAQETMAGVSGTFSSPRDARDGSELPAPPSQDTAAGASSCPGVALASPPQQWSGGPSPRGSVPPAPPAPPFRLPAESLFRPPRPS